MTGHYLNPVVPENYTNNGTTGSFSLSYERELTPKDRLTLIVRHELARYEIPNELVQQNGAYLPNADNTTGCPPVPAGEEPSDCVFIPGGQLQTGDNFETMGSVSYQHIFSSDAIGVLRGMARDNSNDFYSNPASWPLIATQHNDFKEIYFNGSVSVHHGRQEWKAGVESDAIFLHENFSYVMPDCADPADPQCPINLGNPRRRCDNLCLYRQPSRSRAIGLCSGFNPPRQLDGQRRPPLGPLPIVGESERRQPAHRRLALLSLRRRECPRLL